MWGAAVNAARITLIWLMLPVKLVIWLAMFALGAVWAALDVATDRLEP